MTRYFEVLRRDGPARMGRLLLEEPIDTPSILSAEDYISVGSVFDFGTIESAMEAASALRDQKRLVIMPHVPSALHAEPPFKMPAQEMSGPKGMVIHPLFDQNPDQADVYVLGSAGSLVSMRNPRDMVNAAVKARNMVPADTAIFAPALATPSNLALLIYLGIDLIDATKVISDAYYGRYHTRDGVRQLSDMGELPCRCQCCRELREKDSLDNEMKAKLLAGHNLLKLEEELSNAREMIRSETIREYIERQIRVEPGQTAALRLLDQEHAYLEARTPQHRHSILYANTAESLSRVEVTRFADRVLSRYKAPRSDVLLLLPCSARKPYSKSRSHRLFEMTLGSKRKYLHELILTSPLALVPRELEEVYPAANYDTPVTGRWDLVERAWLLRCLDAYLEKNKYARIIAHLDGELRDAVESHGIDAVYTGGGTDQASLQHLSEAVGEATGHAQRLGDFRVQQFRAVADYYFGSGAGDLLLAGKTKIRGYEFQTDGGKILGRLTPNGTIALAMEGARRLVPLSKYIVTIGDFVPSGSLLAPGVLDADEQIRPGDEVIIRGEKAFGIGKAKMSGWEMVQSKRGVAADLRQVKKS
ncbi:MAG TPA: archaeosine synthase subunit alpha [Methanotrichaceae archaeon]|nr:archaeosine synthase subunit alpha [Methanotrichaceae archaeon]